MSKDKKVLTIADVLNTSPGTDDDPAWINDIVEGVVSNVKEAKGKAPVKSTLTMTSDKSVKITAIWWKRGYDEVSEWDGKLISIEDGMVRSRYKPDKGPRIEQLAINTKAEIEVIGESADSGEPVKPEGDRPHRDVPTQQRSTVGQTEASGTTHADTSVNRRVLCYFGVLNVVEKEYQKAREMGLNVELSVGDLKDIATHMSMTYRAEYGAYKEPVFPKKNGMSQSELDKLPEKPWEADTSQSPEKPKLSSWRGFTHAKRKVKLEEIEEADLLGFARWALCLADDEKPEDAYEKSFYANVMMMAAEKRWDTHQKCLAHSLLNCKEYANEFEERDVDGFLMSEYGKTLKELGDKDAGDCVKDFNKFIKGVVGFAKPKKGGLIPD